RLEGRAQAGLEERDVGARGATSRRGLGAALDALIANQLINGTGPQGVGETNNGSIPTSLPVYKQATVGGPAVQVCSFDDAGEFNNLGNRDYVRFSLSAPRSVSLRMVRTSGPTGSDPDFSLFERGVRRANGFSAVSDMETVNIQLGAGEYFVDTYDFNNIDIGGAGNDYCFDFTVN
ncbi:MAG: hypothetical protein AAFQ96_05270, partial [Pseudomonadota bacterium]